MQKLWSLLLVVVMIAGLVGSLGGQLPASADETVPRFEPIECRREIAAADVECGWLIVPEDRADPASPTLRLAVAIVRRAESGTPVIYLHGGPGGQAISASTIYWMRSILPGRDVILLDQRGSGLSEPSLDCPEVDQAFMTSLTDPAPSPAAQQQVTLDAAEACHDRLVASGVNLAAYDSAANAADVDDLRAALGIDQWHLFGISYGTRLALTVMRDYPAGVASVILDSVFPPMPDKRQVTATVINDALMTLFAGCVADERCAERYPTLADDFFALVEQLNAEPMVMDMQRNGVTFTVNGDLLAQAIFIMMYQADLLPTLPRMIANLDDGNYALLRANVSWILDFALFTHEAVAYSIACRELVPFNTSDDVLAQLPDVQPALRPLLEYDVAFDTALCTLWDVPPADPVENAWVTSDIPTLVLTGSYDPITPPAYAYATAEHLSTHYLFEFADQGHGVVSSGCAVRTINTFLADPTTEPDAACVDHLTLRFR